MPEELEFNGVIKTEKQDPRDYKITRFVPNEDMNPLKEFCLDLPENINITKDQNVYSACVGFAFSTALSVLAYQKTHKWIDLDPFMIYGTRYEGDWAGKGMIMREAVKVPYKEGAYLTRDFGKRQEVPEIINTVKAFKEENPNLVEMAKRFCIEGYSFVYYTDEVKTALQNGMPVVVSYDVYGSLNSPGKNGYVTYPQKGKYRGSHAMVIVGWTSDNHWIVLNSWGEIYNGKGAVYIDFREPIDVGIAVSDTITPIKKKCGAIELTIGSKTVWTADNENDLLPGGKSLNVTMLDVAPFIHNNRTFIPVRFVADALGASVEWDAETGTATLRSEENVIKLTTNTKCMYVNDKVVKMDTAPYIVNNRMLIPIRYIAENLNCDVKWDEHNARATIIAK